MNKKVVVYTSDTCVYCHQAKDYLNSKGIQFEERNVSRDMNARKELMSKGFMGVPVIMVDEEVIQGFDRERLEELLG
ncbi:Glutaredoxin-like protein, YruB-family [Caminicella sporogenes DSM 14501]|uniref:Glutaredoxin-like protein, YruB-family n=1 Tax=Caminicella sporogenes DSM 14501 TaxID=1121266 RepID=A0A1M6S652_9FIRM|nr:glutaredoxin family protein [Caminicella sporogenes]RKD27203.1 NrdH-redoxin [Caminicella sporogenes]WIF95495.1 glutaredoxin family protein [Caminicella sporogenes]SHK39987.1 Glutaredoxin-like protein, YruB-family [Caminicella sporogenes DSM 14501]